jgi:DNA-binding CsgD family transcriptional regulator
LLAEYGANELFCVSEGHLPPWLHQQVLPAVSPPTDNLPPSGAQASQTVRIGRSIEMARVTRVLMVEEYARRHRLSERQAQIVGGLVRGLSSKEIAADLSIDYRTVAEHLGRILEKTGASDRHQLVASVVDLLIERVNDPGSTAFPHRN